MCRKRRRRRVVCTPHEDRWPPHLAVLLVRLLAARHHAALVGAVRRDAEHVVGVLQEMLLAVAVDIVHDDRRRRFDVALLNSGFTVGALITPVLVAASLRYGGGRWTFDVIAVVAVGVAALLHFLPDAPMPPPSAPTR